MKLFSHILLSTIVLSLSACGGSSSKTDGDNDVTPPNFLRSKITNSPSYEPSGNISTTTPTFSWKAIENATKYRFGHENTDDYNEWRHYVVTTAQAGCANTDSCQFKPTDFTFPFNVEKVWWVQAWVDGGGWQKWSRPIVFKAAKKGGTDGEIPTSIAPSGNIKTTIPEFTWNAVNGATNYIIGHEDANTWDGWQQHITSATDANCQSQLTCAYTPSNTGFVAGKQVSWWVKAKVNGIWSKWSHAAFFNIEPTSQGARPYIFSIQLDPKIVSNPVREYTISTSNRFGAKFNYNIDCNSDGVLEASGQTTNYTCKYDNYGSHRITVSGDLPGLRFGATHLVNSVDINENRTVKKITVEQWGAQKWLYFSDAFSAPTEVSFIATDTPNLSSIQSIRMFISTTDFTGDISNWDVSSIKDMSEVFARARTFNQDISNWDTSNATTMHAMLANTNVFNQDISNWNTSNVDNMDSLFENAFSFNQMIGRWDTSNVTSMSGMFSGATSFNQSISNWDTGKLQDMSFMFQDAKAFNNDISSWNTSNVRSMYRMFNGATSFDQDISNWDVSRVLTMSDMFSHISTKNYDKLLNSWSRLPTLKRDVEFGAGTSKYSAAGATAKQRLINDYGWKITDGGQQ